MNDETTRTIEIDRVVAKYIALGLAIIGLPVGLVALILQGGLSESTIAQVAWGVSVIGFLGFVLLDPDAIRQALTGRQARYASNALLLSVAFTAILVITYAGLFLLDQSELEGVPRPDWMSIDLTEDKQFTLSQQTLDLLAGLEEPVEVIGFYSNNQTDLREDADLWLQQYRQQSDGMLTYEFVDPVLRPGVATQYGVTRSGVLIFKQGERTAEAAVADERNMTGALVRVLSGEAKQVYALTGHGEFSTEEFDDLSLQNAADTLERQNYEVAPFSLFEGNPVPEDADVVLIARPATQFRPVEVEALSAYLESGGAMMVLMEPTAFTGVRTSGIQDVAFSPDGEFLGTASADDTGQLWDADSGRPTATLSGHLGDVQAIAFSPDGDTVATASADTTVRLWDTGGEEVTILGGEQGHQSTVSSVAWSPDGQSLASAGVDQAVIVWDASSGEAELALYSQSAALDVAFSPDGNLLAATYEDGSVHVWDTSGQEIANQRPHTAAALSLAFSPDGATVLTGGWDGVVGVLDVDSGVATARELYAPVPITDVSYVGEDFVVVSLADLTVRVWDADLSNEQFTLQTEQTDFILEAAGAPDGDTVAIGSADGSVELWSLSDEERTSTLRGQSSGDPLLTYLSEVWGVTVNDDLVVDFAGGVSFDELTPVGDPRTYGVSPITSPLQSGGLVTFFPATRSITPAAEAPQGVIVTELVQASPVSWGETNLIDLVDGNEPDETDNLGPVTIAVSVQNTNTDARLVVVGDADFATNIALQREGYGNVDLFVNSVNWLAEEEEFINIQPRSSERLFQPMSDGAYILVVLGVICCLPGVVLLSGLAVWFQRRRVTA
jgi:WD40 repeat protein